MYKYPEMRIASASPSPSPTMTLQRKRECEQAKALDLCNTSILTITCMHGSSQGEGPGGVRTMANQLCAEIPASASRGETHLSAFSFLRRSVQMAWCGYTVQIWRTQNTDFYGVWTNFLYLTLISISKLQEFWLWELFWFDNLAEYTKLLAPSYSILGSRPLWFR